jgi:hypothetical protein
MHYDNTVFMPNGHKHTGDGWEALAHPRCRTTIQHSSCIYASLYAMGIEKVWF